METWKIPVKAARLMAERSGGFKSRRRLLIRLLRQVDLPKPAVSFSENGGEFRLRRGGIARAFMRFRRLVMLFDCVLEERGGERQGRQRKHKRKKDRA